jgi:hypothetical protein
MSSGERPDLEALSPAEMRARCVSALDQAAATYLETEIATRFWNAHVRRCGEPEIPIPPRPTWLVELLRDDDQGGDGSREERG